MKNLQINDIRIKFINKDHSGLVEILNLDLRYVTMNLFRELMSTVNTVQNVLQGKLYVFADLNCAAIFSYDKIISAMILI